MKTLSLFMFVYALHYSVIFEGWCVVYPVIYPITLTRWRVVVFIKNGPDFVAIISSSYLCVNYISWQNLRNGQDFVQGSNAPKALVPIRNRIHVRICAVLSNTQSLLSGLQSGHRGWAMIREHAIKKSRCRIQLVYSEAIKWWRTG